MSKKTEVPRSFNHGFVLTEQEFRRIVNSGKEQLKKITEQVTESYVAKLRDHTVVEADDIEDVLSLENGGSKEVLKLEIRLRGCEPCEDEIQLRFNNAHIDSKSWESIGLTVTSEDRDWAFLASSDLEDRIAKLRFFSLPRWLAASWFSVVLNGIFFVLLIWSFNEFVEPNLVSEVDKPSALRTAYEAGDFKDPIEAMIFLEEMRSKSHTHWYYLAYFAAIFVLPFSLSWCLKKMAMRVYSAYVFHWGDQIDSHKKAMGRVKILVVAVGLGIVSSVIGSILLKVFWP